MKVLIVEPGRHPREADIPHTTKAMQEVVGGYIDAVYLWEEGVAFVCDDEGALKEVPFNRVLPTGNPIFGNFFICGVEDDDFTDLPPDKIEKYKKLLYNPVTVSDPDALRISLLKSFRIIELL